jgi:hypothetical protein
MSIAALEPTSRPQPLRAGADFYRPSLDVERVRTTWMRTERYFQALKRRDAADALASFGPAAICESNLLGDLDATGVERAITRMLAHTQDLQIYFRIENAGIDYALVSWTARGTLHVTGRPVKLTGTTELSFSAQGIFLQIDRIDMRGFARQALGPKGALLCLIPGWRSFLMGEMRKALQIDEVDP